MNSKKELRVDTAFLMSAISVVVSFAAFIFSIMWEWLK